MVARTRREANSSAGSAAERSAWRDIPISAAWCMMALVFVRHVQLSRLAQAFVHAAADAQRDKMDIVRVGHVSDRFSMRSQSRSRPHTVSGASPWA